MATRKHVLLVLPALLAAMGSVHSAAYASEEIGPVAGIAAAADTTRIELPAVFAAADAQLPQSAASAAEDPLALDAEPAAETAAPLSADDAALRRTVLEIVAEARSRIGLLPELAASPEVVSSAIASPEPSIAPAGQRRTIFDILTEARGNPRFLEKASPPADDPTDEAVIEPLAEWAPTPEDEAEAADTLPPVAAETGDEGAHEIRHVARVDTKAPVRRVANEPLGQSRANAERPSKVVAAAIAEAPQAATAEVVRPAVLAAVAEARSRIGFQPEPATSPEVSAGKADHAGPTAISEGHRPTILDILAEDGRHPTIPEKDAGLAASLRTERPVTSSVRGAGAPAAGTSAAGTSAAGTSAAERPPPSAAEAHRRTVLETVAEARGRIGFLPEPAASPELVNPPPASAEPPIATKAPRRTIFDVLAESRGNPLPPARPAEPPARAGHASEPTAAAGERDVQAPAATPMAGQQATRSKPRLMAAAEIDTEKLDKLRGGFEAPGGLRVSFGIERVVVVNGVLQSSTQMRVNDLGNAVAGQPNAANVVPPPGNVTVVQNGVNNTTLANLPASALATVVQNSLDSQHLQTITRINAVVNSAEMMRTARMQQSLQDSLNRAALAR